MARPITLFTGQWADLPFVEVARLAAEWGYDGLEIALPEVPENLLALDAALTKLAATDKTAADLVHLRFFAGLPLAEAAPLLGISPRTADRLWAYARAWLHQEIRGGAPKSDHS